MDNIVVYSSLLEKYRQRVRQDLAKLQEAALYLKLLKCEFEIQWISIVSFIVSLEEVEIGLDWVCTIVKWPEPTHHHDIQVFFSCANLYWHFISSFSCLAKQMTDMLKGGKNSCCLGPFLPTPVMELSFVKLGDTFIKAPMLACFIPSGPIHFESDASSFALADIILQQQDEVCSNAEGDVRSS
jgi:hypothetical protein